MKKTLLIGCILFVLLVSCATTKISGERIKSLYVLDLSKYTEIGFLFTSEPYLGKYMTVGMLDYSERVAYEFSNQYVNTEMTNFYSTGVISIYDILQEIYEEAIKLGGDCIMNFDINYTETPLPVTTTGYKRYTIPGVEISGTVIKRLDK
jgi:hypothetical protein